MTGACCARIVLDKSLRCTRCRTAVNWTLRTYCCCYSPPTKHWWRADDLIVSFCLFFYRLRNSSEVLKRHCLWTLLEQTEASQRSAAYKLLCPKVQTQTSTTTRYPIHLQPAREDTDTRLACYIALASHRHSPPCSRPLPPTGRT